MWLPIPRCEQNPRHSLAVATLPSALLVSDFIHSVQVGCSGFSRCCYLIGDLSSIGEMEVGPGD